MFLRASYNFMPESISNHSPCVVKLDSHVITIPKSFRFFNMWTLDYEFNNIVARRWHHDVSGVEMLRMVSKLKGSKIP